MPKASQSVTVVIPARYGSSRFPGKPLVELNGKPMIQHVYQRAVACRAVSDALVATDDERIKQAVERFGGRVIMVTGDYRTGTDRVAAVARMFAGEYFLDLQGDEIPLNPELLTDLIEPFLESGAGMGTLKRVMDPTEDLLNSAVVKVVTDDGPVVLAADASHFYENIEDDKPYAILTDLLEMYAAFDRLHELAGADGVVVPGHDPLVRQRHEVLAGSGGLVTVLRPPGASTR